MAVFYVHVWAKCDFCTKLLTKANPKLPAPDVPQCQTIGQRCGQEFIPPGYFAK